MKDHKLDELKACIAGLGRIAVAYSGGVDSTFLLHVSATAADKDNVVAATILSDITPPWDIGFAQRFVEKLGVKHEVIPGHDKLLNPKFTENTPDRCYVCKQFNHKLIKSVVGEDCTVLSGTNASDTGDVRPGILAEQHLGIRAPLKELGFTKDEIRLYSKHLGISGWDRPSSACLASRIPFGMEIEKENLALVREAELFLRSLGFEFCRVRYLPGKTAKIELDPGQVETLIPHRVDIIKALKAYGFNRITLDLEGYSPAGLQFGN